MPRSRKPIAVILAITALWPLAGCTTYIDRYNYQPRPASIRFDVAATSDRPDARVLVSVVGIRRRIADDVDRAGLELKFRVENLGKRPVGFDPREVEVVNAALDSLGSPLAPPDSVTLKETQERLLTLRFPLPAGVSYHDEQLDGFNVRLTLTIGDEQITQSVGFERRRDDDEDRYYYHPYYSPYFHGPLGHDRY